MTGWLGGRRPVRSHRWRPDARMIGWPRTGCAASGDPRVSSAGSVMDRCSFPWRTAAEARTVMRISEAHLGADDRRCGSPGHPANRGPVGISGSMDANMSGPHTLLPPIIASMHGMRSRMLPAFRTLDLVRNATGEAARQGVPGESPGGPRKPGARRENRLQEGRMTRDAALHFTRILRTRPPQLNTNDWCV